VLHPIQVLGEVEGRRGGKYTICAGDFPGEAPQKTQITTFLVV
jgi:hypothetical protein